MLLEYGLKNFFGFKEWTTISFKLDANCPDNISSGLDFSPVMCVKGANSSGKTHLLKALAFLSSFCTKSFDYKPELNIRLSPFFDSKEPSEFFAEFVIDKVLYKYELVATQNEVIRETLFRKKKRTLKILERLGDVVETASPDLEHLKSMKLRKNASIISTANQYEFKELYEIYNFFQMVISNVGPAGLRSTILSLNDASRILFERKDLFDFVKKFISECDTGVSDIKINVREDSNGEKEYFPIFIHKSNGRNHSISAINESSGTKALFRNMALYKIVLDLGGVLVLDEFDINLHSHILPKLIDFFLDPEKNPKNAQFIFTTHNSEVLDEMGRYRSYFVNKNENESFGYRLDEIPGDIVRNGRPILPSYNDGKIGGVPKL